MLLLWAKSCGSWRHLPNPAEAEARQDWADGYDPEETDQRKIKREQVDGEPGGVRWDAETHDRMEFEKETEVLGVLYATVRQRKIFVKNPVSVIRNGVGVDLLTLYMDAEWEEMDSIVCVFTLRYRAAAENSEEYEDREIVREMLHSIGEPIVVPWECLKETGMLSVSCTGYQGGEKIMTTMMPDSFWTVVQNGPVTGEVAMEPTPSLYEQVLAAAGAASSAASAADAAWEQLLEDRENGAFDGVSPTVEVGSVTTGAAGSEAQVTNSGTAQAVRLDFVLPRGAQGPQGARGPAGVQGEAGARGGYYIPSVIGGKLQWTASDSDMEAISFTTQIVGAKGADGAAGGYYLPSVSEDGVLSWVPSDPVMPVPLPTESLKGADGETPVRGADYWTDADIAEIKAYVDEAILGGAW